MKYMLLIYHDEQAWAKMSEAERQEIYGEYRQLIGDLSARGQYLAGDQLQLANTARGIRIREGQQIVTDGPFAETREQIGGFFIIQANDLEQATSIAARIPSARMGLIEIRPVVEESAGAAS